MTTRTLFLGFIIPVLWATVSIGDLAAAGPVKAGAQRGGSPPAAAAAPGKVDIVSVTGCLREQGAGNWMLVMATDPVSSIANAPQKNELPTTAPAGKNEFKLIGVGEFDLPSHKEHTVVVKGLFIKAMPVSRVNVTSVVTALTSCAPSPGD